MENSILRTLKNFRLVERLKSNRRFEFWEVLKDEKMYSL